MFNDDSRVSYTSRNEAIRSEIVDPIEAGDAVAADFDIEAIADEVLDSGIRTGNYVYWPTVTDDEFWEVVARHER